LKEEALNRTVWRNCFGKGLWTWHQTKYWINDRSKCILTVQSPATNPYMIGVFWSSLPIVYIKMRK
jgi:hypothetical protein